MASGTLGATNLVVLAEQAGLSGKIGSNGRPKAVQGEERRVVAAAIALAESGGVIDAVHVNTSGAYRGSKDVGLWQINLKAHPAYTEAQLKDPQANAQAMAAISNGGDDWSAWGPDFKNGHYRAKLAEARKAAKEVGSGGGSSWFDQFANNVGPHLPDVTSPYEAIQQLGGTLSAFFGALLDVGWWKRLALGLASIAVLAAGASLVAEDSLVPPQLSQLVGLLAKVA